MPVKSKEQEDKEKAIKAKKRAMAVKYNWPVVRMCDEARLAVEEAIQGCLKFDRGGAALGGDQAAPDADAIVKAMVRWQRSAGRH